MPRRERITFTIRQDLLKALDNTVDRQRIRNRSHALEIALARALDTHTKQAVILASGQGVKMRPFSYEIPKPLIPVNGRPLLEHSLALLRDNGTKKIIITVSHLAEKIESHFGNGHQLGVNITYVHEKTTTGTGGALYAARRQLDRAPFLLLYGDVLVDLDLNELLQAHQDNPSAVGTLALASVADPSSYGAVTLRGTRIVKFSEKPTLGASASHLVFAGCGVFNHSIFKAIRLKPRGDLSLEQDIFPTLIRKNKLFGYPFEGGWFDVSTPQAYAQALENWHASETK